MTTEAFNTLGGITIGIPPKQIVTESGVVVAAVDTPHSVVANLVYTDNLKFINGANYIAGSNTQIIFNDNGKTGASANLTFDQTTNTLRVGNIDVTGDTFFGDVSTLSIQGGLNGHFLQTDGLGTLTWAQAGNDGANVIPGGSNTHVQYNKSGNFAGSSNFAFNDMSNTLYVGNVSATTFIGNLDGIAAAAVTADTVSYAAQPAITSVGTLTSLNVTNLVTANAFVGSGVYLTNINAANLVGSFPYATTVTGNDQPNINSVGILNSLTVNGNITTSGAISSTGNISAVNVSASDRVFTTNLTVYSNAGFAGNLTVANSGLLYVTGNLNSTNSPNVTLGPVGNIHISGGLNGYVLTTDGVGNLTWAAQTGGSGSDGSPGGSNTQVQYNKAGMFGGSSLMTFNDVTNTLNIGGNLIANSIAIGSGVYKYCTTHVFFASTNSTAVVPLYGINADDISSVDFTIVSTDNTAGSRQVSKISAVIYGATLHYNEYSSLNVNGFTGNFTVGYTPGDIMNPPQAVLYVEPTSSNFMQHKILITGYEPS